jgi:hypothetical protein
VGFREKKIDKLQLFWVIQLGQEEMEEKVKERKVQLTTLFASIEGFSSEKKCEPL